jgi:hypothetical protein
MKLRNGKYIDSTISYCYKKLIEEEISNLFNGDKTIEISIPLDNKKLTEEGILFELQNIHIPFMKELLNKYKFIDSLPKIENPKQKANIIFEIYQYIYGIIISLHKCKYKLKCYDEMYKIILKKIQELTQGCVNCINYIIKNKNYNNIMQQIEADNDIECYLMCIQKMAEVQQLANTL